MKITVTAAQSVIPEAPGRKQLIVANLGPDVVYFGWEEETSADGENQGVPLAAGQSVAFGGRELDLQAPLRFICGEGETADVNYTQRS